MKNYGKASAELIVAIAKIEDKYDLVDVEETLHLLNLTSYNLTKWYLKKKEEGTEAPSSKN